MTENQITPRESMRNLTLSTLERTLIQNTLGSNIIKKDPFKYGQMGLESAENSYDSLMSGEEVQKMKQEEYDATKEEYTKLGVAGEPSYPSNANISYKIMQGLENVMKTSYLEDLAEGVKKVVPKEQLPEKLKELIYDFPEKLKGYIHSELIQKAAEEKEDGKIMINLEKLSEDGQSAIASYQILREAYRRSVAMNIVNSNYLGDLNEKAKQIMEKYNPTKEGKGEE